MGGLSNKHENSPSRRNHLTKQNGDVTDTNRNQLSAGRCRAESCLVCALPFLAGHVYFSQDLKPSKLSYVASHFEKVDASNFGDPTDSTHFQFGT
jgi:hypothetical protein